MKLTHTIAIFAFLSLTACKDLLKESPKYSLNGQTVFLSKNSAQMALNACYGYAAGTGMYGNYLLNSTERASGLLWTRYRDSEFSQYAQLNYSPDNLRNNDTWEGLYKEISECNSFIVNVEQSKLPEKAHMAAQARFLRGLAYYNLVTLYGGVPLRIGESSAATIHLPRASKAEVFDQIIKDFNDAAQSLNNKETDTSVPSKISAYAMLAKVYFFMASNEGEGSANWQKAKDAGEKVFAITGNTAPLEPNFATLFKETTTESVESIFKLNYSMSGLGMSQSRHSYIYSPIGSTAAGINYGEAWITKSFFNYFKQQHPGDPRIDASFFHTNYLKVGASTPSLLYPRSPLPRNNYAWPYTKKRLDSRQIGSYDAHTFFVYRFADFLLFMADVENELGNSNKAIEYVNRIYYRARHSISPAAASPADLNPGLSKVQLRQIIFDERLFELNMEGHSFMDTRRRGTAFLKQIVDRHNNDPDTQSSFNVINTYVDRPLPDSEAALNKALLFSIPTKEISTNNKINISDQNPGY